MMNQPDDRSPVSPIRLTSPSGFHRIERWAKPPHLPYAQPSQGGGDALEPAELWHTLVRNWFGIALVTAAVVTAVSAVTLFMPMKFVAKGRLYLGELDASKQPANQGPGAIDLTGGTEGDVSSELAIVGSRSLVERAVLKSGLNVELAPLESEPLRYYTWRLHRRDPKLLDVATRHVVPTNTILEGRVVEPRSFTVRFQTESDYSVWAEGNHLGAGALGQPAELSGLHLTLEAGEDGPPSAGTELAMVVTPLDLQTDAALRSLEITAPQQVGHEPIKVVTLSFTGASPFFAARFLDTLMKDYLAERQSWKTETATAAEAFVTRQLRDLQGSLDQVESQLADYRSENRVVVHTEEAQAMVAQIGKYEEQRVAARLEVAALAQVERALSQPDAPIEAYMLGEAKDTALETLATSLARAKQELTNQKARFHAAAPQVREQQAVVDAQLESIRGYVKGRLSRARANLGTLNGIIGQFEDKLRTVPGAELKLAQLARESEVYSSIYSFLLQKQQQAAIVKASNVSQNRILDVPEIPRKEDSPKLAFIVMSLPLGLVLGAGVVLLVTLFRGRLRSERDTLRALGPMPVFARIPRRGTKRGKPTPISELEGDGEGAAFVEAFRTLRTRLSFALAEQSSGGVILITSPCPGDGKTTCTFALASMLAADGKRVLVLDTDLRNPSHAKLLAEFVADYSQSSPFHAAPSHDPSEAFDTPRPVRCPLGTFDSLSFDEGAPAELLSSSELAMLLRQVRTSYDYVLLDSAAYPLVSDALILASEVDAIVTVLRLHKTGRKRAQEHIAGLLGFGVPHALVLNNDSDRPVPLPKGTPRERLRSAKGTREPLAHAARVHDRETAPL